MSLTESVVSKVASTTESAHSKETSVGLSRRLGLVALVSIGLGIVISQGAMVTMLQVTGLGGTSFFVALCIALLISLCYVDTFSELALMLPQASGLGRYTEVALGPYLAIFSTFSGYLVVTFFATSAELLLVDAVVQQLMPGVVPEQSVAFMVLLLATLLNIFGIDMFARIQNLITVLKIGSMLGLGVLALMYIPASMPVTAMPTPAAELNISAIIPLVATVIWGLMGAEYICPMIEETRKPSRIVPLAMYITLGLATLMYGVLSLGALHVLPHSQLANAQLPHLLLANAVAGRWGTALVAVAALSASVGLVFSALAVVPRILYGMACEGQAFQMFQRIHPRFQTPWVAIIAIALAIGVLVSTLRGETKAITVLILSASTAWLIAYIVAHLDVIVLRRRYPHLARPYRSRWLPWPQWLGIIAMLYCLFNVSPDPSLTTSIYLHAGVVLLLVASIALIWVKVVQRRALFESTKL